MNRTVYPLTDSQRGVYLECIERPESLKYNIPVLCRLPADTDAPRFIEAVKTVAKAHPALFVTFDAPGGVPSMILREFDVTVTEKTVGSFEEEYPVFLRPFDLSNGPLFRFEYLHTPEEPLFLYDIHHLLFDGTSLNLLIRQIIAVYEGGECPAEDMTLFDRSDAEAAPKDPETLAAYQEFFRQRLEGIDGDAKPLPDVIAEDIPEGSAEIALPVTEFTVPEVTDYIRAHGLTENALFLGAFGYALTKLNGMTDCAFATVHNGRLDPRLSGAVGMFVRTLPVACHPDETAAPADYLKGISDDYYREKKNEVISFGELAAQYGVSNDVTFIYHGQLLNDTEMGGQRVAVSLPDTGEPIAVLDVMVQKGPEGFWVRSHYQRALYSEAFIRRLLRLFLQVVRGMMTAETLGEIPLTDPESEAMMEALNRTEADYGAGRTIVERFRDQAAATPDNLCLVYKDHRYTYREVDTLTDALAARLVKAGVGREKVVGILIPRCEYMLIAALGVLKAGGAYLPLDPTYPPERLNLMVKDSGAMLLIADPGLAAVIGDDFSGERMLTTGIPALPPCDISLPTPRPEDLFVVLYTSGSTGLPKGVMFQHGNSLVTVQWVKKYYHMDETSRVTAYASYGFDANVFDMYPAVTCGAALHIISDDIRLDFPALRDYYNENGITHTVMTTQVGRQFALMGGLKTLRHLSVAGEKLTPPDVPEGFALYNLYGPSEGSVITSAFRIDRRYKDVPIGTAVDNLKLYVVDKNGRLLPPGAVGELWIAGPHVTRGYLNRPEKTAEAYGDNPFTDQKGYERVYRTGDIVRLLPDGNLQFVGRRDAQVKVRGFRVELTEIEEVIRRFPGIEDVTVAAFDDPAGGKFVAAYVVAPAPVDTAALADFIRAEKPPYMVPAVTMQIDKIPLNQNQKVNRRALPTPERTFGEIVPPENGTQQKIYDLVAEVVGHQSFGITTDLYEAGLTSIGAVRLNVALADAFSVPLKIADIKQNSTVKALSAFLSAAAPGETYALQADYPLTETQNGIFVECMAAPDTTVYNIPALFRLGGGVDTARLCGAVKAAIDAHPYVKTTLFTDGGGNVRAARRDGAEAEVSVIRCAALPEPAALVRPYTLLGAPLYRAAIYETDGGTYLFLDFHHIVSDGTSEGILLRDIDRAYAGEALTPETFSGFEAALSEQAARQGEGYEQAKAYWRTRLSGCDTDCLPKKEPEAAGGVGSLRVESPLDAAAVRDFCQKNGLTPNALFNSAFAFVLSRFTGKDSVTYATIHNGRSDSRLAEAVTMLVKTVPVTADPEGDTPVLTFVKAMQEQLSDSMARDLCSFAELSHEYGVKADILFAYQGDMMRFDTLCGEPTELLTLPLNAAKMPCSLNVYLEGDRFVLVTEYRREMYSAPFARALSEALSEAVASLMQSRALKEVTLLTEAGEALYRELNAAEMAVEPVPAHRLFERCAAARPEAPAVTAAGRTLTYGEMNEKSDLMARALRRHGVGPDRIVGLVLDRSCEIPLAQMAILKAGGAFLPMLPSYPDERIDYCLTNADSPCVLTTEALKAERPDLFAEGKSYAALTVEGLLSEGAEAAPLPPKDPAPEQLAYCIYTSGSTGNPKGVMVEHRNLTNLIVTHWALLTFYSEGDCGGTALSTCSVSFDASILDIFPPLCCGRHLVLCTEEEHHDPLALRDLMLRHRVMMTVGTPSFMSNLVSLPEMTEALGQLKTIVVGAEAFPAALYEGLRKCSPTMQIVNGYGPTETTVCCSAKVLTGSEGITIGRSTGNVKQYVVDRFGHILPPYAMGELIICGAGVTRGYVKLPEKTAASFFTLRGLPAYHSGDLVRLNGQGEIDFGGRIDNQVKLRGFRVELDEIEKVLRDYGPVTQSKVLVRNNGTEDYLAAFFTASEPVDLDALTAHLKSRLTYYMVPAAMMQLDQMPLTPNGKIDKNGFPEVRQTARRSGGRKAAKKSLEQRLCEIFASILSLEEVFADDNFFELGGTSLSASKVTMMLMSEGIEVKYGDIFDNPTPEALAAFVERRDAALSAAAPAAPAAEDTAREALSHNRVKYAPKVKREPLGAVLLTGAVGFLGIHILRELLTIEEGPIYCLVRRGRHETPEIRLKTMLIYYFSDGFDEALRDRITVIDADITDEGLEETLREVPFDTVINCAACVKHFSDSDILERVNVHGVENLIALCEKRGAKLIQISTVSVPGIHTKETYENQVRMHEHELFVIDDMDNKYGISKYHAELRMLDAIDRGMRGKIIRVGNLMGRHSDGEFQANLETNMFLSGIRGFATMGKYPISHMTDPMRFSPVDCTARAVVLLAGTNDEFTAFNCDNRYGFDEMKIIDACNRCGIPIVPTADEDYYAEYREKLGDDRINGRLNGLAAYDIQDAHAVDTDNLFTTNILYRIGFSWPLTDDAYLDRAIESILTLDYFGMPDEED